MSNTNCLTNNCYLYQYLYHHIKNCFKLWNIHSYTDNVTILRTTRHGSTIYRTSDYTRSVYKIIKTLKFDNFFIIQKKPVKFANWWSYLLWIDLHKSIKRFNDLKFSFYFIWICIVYIIIFMLSNPADAQNVSCLGLCGREICPKSSA